MKKSYGALIVFFVTFLLYLSTAGPSVVPFRDAGEMATTTTTLGILHPPGYPLYTLMGHLATRLPLANPAYRLNIFSAVCMAGCWAFFYLLVLEVTGSATSAWAIAALGAFSYHFWSHALVSEMYALNAMLVVGVLTSAAKRRWAVVAILCGVACANRLDFLLCLPTVFILMWPELYPLSPTSWKLTLLGTAGLGLYLYLPFRALQRPLMNWNDPSTVDQFISSLMRRGYGSGLDLLSQSYASGANFRPEFILYAKHTFWDFGGLLLPFAVIGCIALWKRSRRWFWSLLLGFGITGPLFIFLGNLPANPHAVAIMESAYLVPDLFLLAFASIGFAEILNRVARAARIGLTLALSISLLSEMIHTFPVADRRDNYLAIDFAHTVYAAVPPGSLVIARSDVPLFSLFYAHYVAPSPRDRVPIAQGLAGSFWYQEMLHRELHQELQWSGSLKQTDDWNVFRSNRANANRPLFATEDTEWPTPLPANDPWGPLQHITGSGLLHPVPALPPNFLNVFGIYRGVYRYDAYRDFFSSELVEEYAKAWMSQGNTVDAHWHALSLKPDMPYAAERLGYDAFTQGNFKDAERYYAWSVTLFGRMVEQTVAWNTLTTTQKSVEEDYAGALAQAGVVEERLGHTEKAESDYMTASSYDPTCADALYNLAVIYWKKGNWPAVVEQFQTLARFHPNDARWKQYLPIALQHVGQAP